VRLEAGLHALAAGEVRHPGRQPLAKTAALPGVRSRLLWKRLLGLLVLRLRRLGLLLLLSLPLRPGGVARLLLPLGRRRQRRGGTAH